MKFNPLGSLVLKTNSTLSYVNSVNVIQSQAFVPDCIKSTFQNVIVSDLLLHIERLLSLYGVLSDARTKKAWFGALNLYLSSYTDSSTSALICKYYNKIFGEIESQAGETAFENFLSLMKSSLTDYESICQCEMFQHVSSLISMCLSLGLCSDKSKYVFSLRGLEVFRVYARKEHVSAIDLMEACLKTSILFIERGYRCFTTRSFMPILFSTDEALDYEKEYVFLVNSLDYLQAGRIQELGLDENDFEARLERHIEKSHSLISSATSKFARAAMNNKLMRLTQLRTSFQLIRCSGGLREAPFCMLFHGGSSVGKSTVCTAAVVYALRLNGFDCSQDTVVSLNGNDKFQSEYRSYHNGVILDDIANTAPDFVEVSPNSIIIDFCNNIKKNALNANAELKGRIQMMPKIVAGTTNVKGVNAEIYSNEPFSILRRFNLHVRVCVRPEFGRFGVGNDCLDPSKMIGQGALPDAWLLDIEEVFPKPARSIGVSRAQVGYRFVSYNGKPCQGVGINVLMDVIKEKSVPHFLEQRSLLHTSVGIFTEELCPHQRLQSLCEDCIISEANILGLEIPLVLTDGFDFPGFDFLMNFCYFPRAYFVRMCVDLLLTSSIAKWLLVLFGGLSLYALFCVFTSFGAYFLPYILAFVFIWLYFFVFMHRIRAFRRLDRVITFADIFRIEAVSVKSFALKTFAFAASLYAAYKIYNAMRGRSEGAIVEDATPNIWKAVERSEIPVSNRSKSLTCDELFPIIEKQLCCVTAPNDTHFNGLLIQSGVMLVPTHVFPQHPVKVRAYRTHRGIIGSSFNLYLDKGYSVSIGNDMSIMYVPGSGDVRDLTPFFPGAFDMKRMVCTTLFRDIHGFLIRGKSVNSRHPARISTDKASFNGWQGSLSGESHMGFCGAVYVAETKNPFILGVHQAGRPFRRVGYGSHIYRESLRPALEALFAMPHCVRIASQSDMTTLLYGVDFTPSGVIPVRSPTRYLEDGTLENFGSIPIRSGPVKSSVVPTPISGLVYQCCGVPQLWGAPNFKPAWKPWQTALSSSASPTIGFPSGVVVRAFVDYQNKVDDFLRCNAFEVAPLSDVAVVSGIDGVKFIDAMKQSTSIGFPLNRKKSNYLTPLEATEDNAAPFALHSMFWNEAQRMEERYMSGERSYPIFRGSLKDEPTKLVKDKVRVFQGAPIALQLLMRRYFLPLTRIISSFPEVFECAVGLNCHSREWDRLVRHINRFGGDRVVAGDFKSFDLTMPAHFILMTFEILINMARHFGYSRNQLQIMEGLATDVAYPLVEYNGELIQLFGSNPSGQNLTVFTNSIVNSLYHRCAYYTIYGHLTIPQFAEVMSLITYGDDCKASVSVGYDDLNHTNIAKVFADVGIIYTMADKDADSVPFISHLDAPFLKRNTVYNTHVKLWFAALDELSIFKSLHCMDSKTLKFKTMDEHCGEAIDGALDEWFFHGPDVFECRRLQLLQLSELASITEHCGKIHVLYDERMLLWESTYLPSSPSGGG
jgi:hypothetical protein